MVNELAQLVNKYGKEGALRAAKAAQPGLTALEEASEETIKSLLENSGMSLGKKVALGTAGLGAAAAAGNYLSKPTEGTGPVASGKEYANMLETPPDTTEVIPLKASLKEAISKPGSYKVVSPDIEQFSFDDPEYRKAIEAYAGKADKAEKELKRAQDITNWGKIASLLGEGLVKYGAAREGLRKDVDLSKIDIAKPDWDSLIGQDQAAYDRAKKRMDTELGLAKETSSSKEKEALRNYLAKAEAASEKAKAETERNKTVYQTEARAAELGAERAKDIEMEKARNNASLEKKLLELSSKADTKTAAERNKSLGALQAAYLSGDKKIISKAFSEAGQYLSPEELASVDKAGGFFFSSKDKAAKVGELRKESMVEMVAPDGRLLKVPANEVSALEAKGARRK